MMNKEIVRNARVRTQIAKELPTLRLLGELGQNKYQAKAQEYIKLNKHKIDEIRYIFKMRIRVMDLWETLFIRNLI